MRKEEMIQRLEVEEEIVQWAVELGRRAKKGRAKLFEKIGLL